MKKFTPYYLLLLAAMLFPSALSANGVGILDAAAGYYLRLDSSTVNVSVQGQISITVATQYFTNKRAGSTGTVKYGFPMREQASATQLRWKVSGLWRTAAIVGKPQDPTLPGGGTPNANLTAYLGSTPLYFGIPQAIRTDSTLAVELTYVELLPYSFGSTTYAYPNDYRRIDPAIVLAQKLTFNLTSQRAIDSIKVTSGQTPVSLVKNTNSASVVLAAYETAAAANYTIRYVLNANQLGLFAYSTKPPDSLIPDRLGGFLTFIAEPDPGNSIATIAKVFTLIVDCSGSMSGTKIVQARDAAAYIVQNLNAGDKFNIVRFESNVASFRPGHVNYTAQTRDSALTYISQFVASGGTNISGAFGAAVPQFKTANDSTANIVIFLTDGQPTEGITAIPTLTTHIDSLITATETKVNLFSFGIGTDANQQLLTLISSHNSGLSAFLGNDSLYTSITSFYNTIRNPVLLNPRISFNPPLVSEIYPNPLPNLYKGQQMIVTGRYLTPGNTQVTLSGNAFGRPVSYTYNITLAGNNVAGNEFLPKIWAKKKIETLLVTYYGLSPTSTQATDLKNQIIALSQAYQVLSPFTSLSAAPTAIENKTTQKSPHSSLRAFDLLGTSTDPAGSLTTIRIRLNIAYSGILEIRIYDLRGQVVGILRVRVNGKGEYSVIWDGRHRNGSFLTRGSYVYTMALDNTVLAGRLIRP